MRELAFQSRFDLIMHDPRVCGNRGFLFLPLVGSRRAKLALRVAHRERRERCDGWGSRTAVRGKISLAEAAPHPTGLRPATLPTTRDARGGRDKKPKIPHAPLPASRSRNSRRRIFPTLDFGSASMNSTILGIL